MAATSITRSRRADGFYQPPHHYASTSHYTPPQSRAPLMSTAHANADANTRTHNTAGPQASQPRHKRLLEDPEPDANAIKRRKGIVVEIPSAQLASRRLHQQTNTGRRPPMQPASRPSPLSAPQPPLVAKTDDPTRQLKPSRLAAAAPGPALAPTTTPTPTRQVAQSKVTAKQRTPTDHRKKVANGLKHELDRLQPSQADTRAQGRKLRSQEATRFKSELSAYFPDYDEVIGNDPKEEHRLNINTPIVITSSQPALVKPLPTQISYYLIPRPTNHLQDSFPVKSYGDHLFTDLNESQRINFDFLQKAQYVSKFDVDPLPDTVYEHSHKKAERLERSIRNTERGRAQHERDQVIRLLGGLQGPDWLRIMGVSGVTESKKKTFQPARTHFIKGCHAIIDKFKAWTAEERRRKLEKERKVREQTEAEEAEEEEAEEDEEVEEDNEVSDEEEDEERVIPDSQEDEDVVMHDVDGELPDSSDVDVVIARQLREEALAAAKSSSRPTRSLRSVSIQPPVRPPEPAKDFKSFFAKPYQRDSALNRNRRRGRTVLAWGHAIPEFTESDFELPEEYHDEDTMKTHARKRRKEKRHRE